MFHCFFKLGYYMFIDLLYNNKTSPTLIAHHKISVFSFTFYQLILLALPLCLWYIF